MKNRQFHFETYMDAGIFKDFSFFNSFLFQGRWVSLTLFPLIMAGLAVLNLITGSPFLFRLFLILALACPGLYMIFYKISLRNQIKVNSLETKQLVYSTLFDNGKIEVSSRNEKQPLEWEQIHRIFRYKKCFYLYITRSRAFILPESGLVEIGQADDFWEYAQQMAPEGQCRSYSKGI